MAVISHITCPFVPVSLNGGGEDWDMYFADASCDGVGQFDFYGTPYYGVLDFYNGYIELTIRCTASDPSYITSSNLGIRVGFAESAMHWVESSAWDSICSQIPTPLHNGDIFTLRIHLSQLQNYYTDAMFPSDGSIKTLYELQILTYGDAFPSYDILNVMFVNESGVSVFWTGKKGCIETE